MFRKFYLWVNLFLLFVVAPASLSASQFPFTTYTTRDGLPVSQMWTMHQDRDGYLWIGSYGGGVTRYNGVEFQTFMTEHGLAHNVVHSIFEDSVGHLWFATLGGGASYWDGEQFKTVNTEDGLPGNLILALCEDRSGRIWFGFSGHGLGYWDGQSFFQANLPDEVKLRSVQSLCEDKEGRLWIGVNSGLYLYDGRSYVNLTDSLRFSPQAKRKTVLHIYRDPQERLWLSCWEDGVRVYENGQFRSIPALDGLKGHLVWDITRDADGDYWFAADDLYKYEPDVKSLIKITSRQGLPPGEVRSVIQDFDGNIWISALGGGVSKLGQTVFATLNDRDGLVDSNITAICEDQDDLYWFGSANNGVTHSNGDHFTTANGLTDNRITSLACDHYGQIWVGASGGGINIIKDRAIIRTITANDGLTSNVVNVITVGQDSMMWVGLGHAGLFCVVPQTFIPIKKMDSYAVNDIKQDSQGRTWLGSVRGLTVFDRDSSERLFTKSNGLVDNYVICLEIDDKDNVWIGTVNGASFLENGATSTRHMRNIPTGPINFIQQDLNGFIWFGTPRGVDRYDPATQVRAHFDSRSGLAGDETNIRASFLDNLGHPWFGATEGVSYYLYENSRANLRPPPIYVESFQLFGQPIFNPAARIRAQTIHSRLESRALAADPAFFEKAGVRSGPDKPLYLSHDQNYCSFEFVGLNFSNSNTVQYRYRLIGLDKDWLAVTDHQFASYPNLEPGDYTFQVSASKENGKWNPKPAQFSFVIETPWWGTAWFKAMLVLCFGFIGTSLYYRRMQQLHHEKDLELAYQRDVMETQRLQDEMEQARQVQMSMLPRENPTVPGYDIVGMSSPATEVGGDYYDFIWQMNRDANAKQDLGIIVGDVAGHGMSSGLVVSMCKSSVYLFNQIINNPKPSQILSALNDMICQTSQKQILMTCVYAHLNPKSREITFSSAGHPFPFHYRAADDVLEEIELIAFPLGVPNTHYQNKTIHLQVNDVVLLYTDGIVESQNARQEMFSFDRLAEFLRNNAQLPADEILNQLMREVNVFTSEESQVDDITLVVIKVKS